MSKLKLISFAATHPILFYKKIKSFIGGSLEEIKLNNKYSFIVDAEGKMKKLPKNEKATKLYKHYCKTEDYLCGDVLLIKYK
jgi:hypothetical protein